jgi:RNA-directed DNA polymerase
VSSEGDSRARSGAAGADVRELPPLESVSTRQRHIAAIARKHAGKPLTTLSHHLDELWLREAYGRVRRDSAPGVDGQTVAAYGEKLSENLRSLLKRVREGSYRAPPVKRVHIPKSSTETRPIGLPTVEDKVLARAVTMLLEPVYEQEFLDCSHGFRPGRSPHGCLEALRNAVMALGGGWVLDVDVRKFFDTIPIDRLRALVRRRIGDGVIDRLIGKWLNAGVWENGGVSYPEAGTPQGSVISPLLSNVFLHEVLDTWFEHTIKPQLRGRAELIRFADDFVIVCKFREDAEDLLAQVSRRFAEHGLQVHPEKTRIVDFRDPLRGAAPQTFDFLGFTHYWAKTLKGGRAVKRKTRTKKLRSALTVVWNWCKEHRHEPMKTQHRDLSAMARGHYAYYGIRGNSWGLERFREGIRQAWHYWLRRRSRLRGDPERLWKLLDAHFRLPRPRLVHPARPEQLGWHL